jgi:hypothetical protein
MKLKPTSDFEADQLDDFDRGFMSKHGIRFGEIRTIRRKALRRAAQQDLRAWLIEQLGHSRARRSPWWSM